MYKNFTKPNQLYKPSPKCRLSSGTCVICKACMWSTHQSSCLVGEYPHQWMLLQPTLLGPLLTADGPKEYMLHLYPPPRSLKTVYIPSHLFPEPTQSAKVRVSCFTLSFNMENISFQMHRNIPFLVDEGKKMHRHYSNDA